MKSAYSALVVGALLLGACEGLRSQRQAMGEPTSLIVVATDSLWTEAGERVEAALEPRIFAVHDETTFELTQVAPTTANWTQLQRFRQIVTIGASTDPWVAAVLEGADGSGTTPRIVERNDVWARNQSVTAVVLPSSNAADALATQLDQLGALLDSRFRKYALARMFASDSNVVLRDSLSRRAGFSILLPNIYQPMQPADTVYAFHNRNEVGGDLFRTITVAWHNGVDASMTPASVLEWRDKLTPMVFDLAQKTMTDHFESKLVDGAAAGSIEVQGVWAGTDPSFPTGGLFIDRVIVCPDQNRTYFLEAWMYGPSRRKYEYLLQFEHILGSFRCGTATG
jgi:Domain of unknown function (DUF4837)